MITKVRFPEPVDVYGDGNPKAEWIPNCGGDLYDGLTEIIPLRGSADTMIFVFIEGQRRFVVLPRGAIVHEHRPDLAES